MNTEMLNRSAPSESSRLRESYLGPVCATLDTLIERGTDRYGLVHSPIWMSILDVETLGCPRDPLALDEDIRVQRRGRRAPGGGNLFLDQAMLRAAEGASELTGNARYLAAARSYATYYLEHFVDSQTGLIEWGPHNFVDAYDDAVKFLEGHYHEIHAWMPYWSLLHTCHPAVIEREIEQIWQWHFNHETAQFGRHPEHGAGCSFAMTGGEFIAAFAFMHRVTQAPCWLDRARRAARVHWAARNPRTNLIPNQAEWEDRFDAESTDSSISGLWCGRLLAAAALSEDRELLDLALAELQAISEFQWRGVERPWGQLNLDGTPVLGPRVPIPPNTPSRDVPYACWAPRGELDLWPAYVLGYEYPQETAMTCVHALALTGDPRLRAVTRRWAELYRAEEKALRARGGTYAQHYGMVISFFGELAVVTGDRGFLETAEAYARQAIDLLFTGRIFRGHPAKPYYEAADGVGFLVYGLVQLQQALEGKLSLGDPLRRNV
ncbi:MAG TPA: hypothetical protein VFT72_18715 [Opitutaceae bacterium]|nr:hypothetical protein [Opitutaceae bacterium]